MDTNLLAVTTLVVVALGAAVAPEKIQRAAPEPADLANRRMTLLQLA